MRKKVIPVVTENEQGATSRPPLAVLRIQYADGQIEERDLDIGCYDLGRVSADILLPGDRSVSRLHARLEITPTEVTLTDLASTSGTFDARGLRLQEPQALGLNDSFRIGHAVLSLVRLNLPSPSGVMRGARPTLPAIPVSLRRGITQASPPTAQRRDFEDAPEAKDATATRESTPAVSGPRAKNTRPSKKPPSE